MPIYLCLPGHASKEPWRHGMRIFDRPHDLDESDGTSDNNTSRLDKETAASRQPINRRSVSDSSNEAVASDVAATETAATETVVGADNNEATEATSIRKARHAEVLLADSLIQSHGRSWLRLRWPGPHGGFGGFVALDRADVDELKQRAGIDAAAKEKSDGSSSKYPTSKSMKLLEEYDDGLDEGEEGESGEPVFCRICREGLHDVNYDLEPTNNNSSTSTSDALAVLSDSEGTRTANEALSDTEGARAATNESATTSARNEAEARSSLQSNDSADTAIGPSPQQRREQQQHADPPGTPAASPPLSVNLPPLVLHHPTADNPLLAPCSCTGSMAFVHYLCVEQWRCRSRHPDAKNGLNCETCKAEYTLPPPPSRPSRSNIAGEVMGEEDWMDAMPPHVLAALRRPHPWWQIGAAAVRRRWLRPFVPIVVSPLVALYCRARRTLKKRGVSRRRWACSLCRRRARWKCVRCLRSYYCSRQCQNVSWHIVHKHVCYKPGRFWWSVVVYSVGVLAAVPGILKDLLLYDLMLTLLPINFLCMGIIAGGFASTIKFHQGSDIRGRMLELAVVFFTIWLTILTSGLVNAYFGDTSKCAGFAPVMGSLPIGHFGPLLTLLKYSDVWYRKWDYAFGKLGIISDKILCVPGHDGDTTFSAGCSPSIRNINPEFYLGDEGQYCRADIVLVLGCWTCALAFVGAGHIDRYLRARRAAEHRARERPHQD